MSERKKRPPAATSEERTRRPGGAFENYISQRNLKLQNQIKVPRPKVQPQKRTMDTRAGCWHGTADHTGSSHWLDTLDSSWLVTLALRTRSSLWLIWRVALRHCFIGALARRTSSKHKLVPVPTTSAQSVSMRVMMQGGQVVDGRLTGAGHCDTFTQCGCSERSPTTW